MSDDTTSVEDTATEDAAVERLLASWVEEDKADEEAADDAPPWGEDFDPNKAWRTIQQQRESEKQLKAKLKEFEDRDKSESQKLSEDRDSHKSRADKAEAQLARYKVAMAKGLTPGQAKRLVGSTEEELTADADEMLAELGGGSTSTARPTERLRGGGAPDDEPDEDIASIVNDIPRL